MQKGSADSKGICNSFFLFLYLDIMCEREEETYMSRWICVYMFAAVKLFLSLLCWERRAPVGFVLPFPFARPFWSALLSTAVSLRRPFAFNEHTPRLKRSLVPALKCKFRRTETVDERSGGRPPSLIYTARNWHHGIRIKCVLISRLNLHASRRVFCPKRALDFN